ncbi:YqbF domain-containing protein [Bacillus sp. NPDC077411]|uniref:YqbF domain-containing protein n=1 Tax=Bacillus sp. NPDC077411 TaxID=3363947 RepID=UPI0037C738D3
MYYAKLVKGKTYDVLDHRFVDGVEQKVNEEVYDYLKQNKQFELWEADDNTHASLLKSDGEKYTEQDLKALKKNEQESIIRSLTKGDFIQETKNEQERIALILELQNQVQE